MASSVDNKPNWEHPAARTINRWITPDSIVEKHERDVPSKSENGERGVRSDVSETSQHEPASSSFTSSSDSGHPVEPASKTAPTLSHHQRYVNGRNSPSSLSFRMAGGAAAAASKQPEQRAEVEVESLSKTPEQSSGEEKVHNGWIIETPAGDANNKNGWIQDSAVNARNDVVAARRSSSASQAAVKADIQVSDPRSEGKRMSLNEYIAETASLPSKVDEYTCRSCGSIVNKEPIYASVSASLKADSLPGLVSAPDSRRTSTSTASLAPPLPHGYIPTDIIYGWGPGVTASTPVSVAGDTDAALSSRKASTASIASSILYPKPLPSGAVTPEDLAYGWGPSQNTSFSKEDDLMELSLDIAKRKAGISPQASIVSDITVKEAVSPTATTFSEMTLVDDYKPSKIIGWKDDNDDITTINPSWNGWDLSSKMQKARLPHKDAGKKEDDELKHDVKKPPRREYADAEKYSNNKDVRAWSSGVSIAGEGDEAGSPPKNSYFSSAYQNHLRGSSTSKFANHQLFHGHNDWE